MRIQIDLDKESVEWIEQLKERTGLRTHKDLLNNSLTLLDWAVQQREAGRVIASVDERTKDYKELQMPAVEHAVVRARAAAPAVAQSR